MNKIVLKNKTELAGLVVLGHRSRIGRREEKVCSPERIHEPARWSVNHACSMERNIRGHQRFHTDSCPARVQVLLQLCVRVI